MKKGGIFYGEKYQPIEAKIVKTEKIEEK